MRTLPISKTAFAKLVKEISNELGCKGYIREYSWRNERQEWNGDTFGFDDAYEFFNPEEPNLNIHYFNRPAPGEEPTQLHRVVTVGNILRLIENGYEIKTEEIGNKDYSMRQNYIYIK